MNHLQVLPGGRASVQGRVPPHNLEAEVQAIAHALGNRRDIAIGISVGLLPEHFHDPAHGRVWEAILALASSGGDVTRTTVHEWLRARGWLEKIGGEKRLRELADETALAGPMRAYSRIVVTLARVRVVQAEAHLLANEPYGDIGDPETWLESAPLRVAERARGPRSKGPQPFAETLKASWELFNATAGQRGGYATGLEPFDSAIGGLHPGEVLLVSAKEKAGKSMLVGQWFASLAFGWHDVIGEDGQPVCDARGNVVRRRRAALIFALDSAKQTDWAERVASADALVDLERFRLGTANDADRSALSKAIDRASDLPVFVDSEDIGSVGQMGARIRALRDELAERGIDLCAIAIDYIQLAKGEGRSREEQIGSAMRGVVHLAGQKDLRGVAWVVISQTNSEGELAHCRALAQMCDSWIHLAVDDDKPAEEWWQGTAQGGEHVPVYPATLTPNRSRRGRMGKRAQPIALWACYRFTFFYGGAR